MSRFVVAVYRTPGPEFVASRRFEAADRAKAMIEAYRLTTAILSRRKVAKFRCQWRLYELSPMTGQPVLLHWARYASLRGATRLRPRKTSDTALGGPEWT